MDARRRTVRGRGARGGWWCCRCAGCQRGGADKGFTVKFNENDLSDIEVFGVSNQGPAGVSAESNWWGTGTDVEDMISGDGVGIEPYCIGPEMQEKSDGSGAPDPDPGSVENLFGSLTGSLGSWHPYS